MKLYQIRTTFITETSSLDMYSTAVFRDYAAAQEVVANLASADVIKEGERIIRTIVALYLWT